MINGIAILQLVKQRGRVSDFYVKLYRDKSREQCFFYSRAQSRFISLRIGDKQLKWVTGGLYGEYTSGRRPTTSPSEKEKERDTILVQREEYKRERILLGRPSDTKFIQARYAIQILCKVPRAGGQLTVGTTGRGLAFVICSNFASIYTRAADTRPEK